MPAVTRESIDAALFAIVDTAVGHVVNLVTSSRRMLVPSEVTPALCPALFLVKTAEENHRSVLGLPSKRTMKFELILYTANPQTDDDVQMTQMNAMVDAIDDAFNAVPMTSAVTGGTTLGGLVFSARVDGTADYFARTKDGLSVAVIPVAVLIP